jgi:hypothetical protein
MEPLSGSSQGPFLLEPSETWKIITWGGMITCVMGFTIVALYLAKQHATNFALNPMSFLSAKQSQSWTRIGWAMYAGTMGAWVLTLPGYFASVTGWFGLLAYGISTGIPVLLVAYAGQRVQQQCPDALSLLDFVRWRFGMVLLFKC